MDRDQQVARLVEHFQQPRHKGTLEAPDARVDGGNPGCGDLVTMYVAAAPDEDRLEQVVFEGTGCTISQAAASILAEKLNQERPGFDAIMGITYEEMMELLGKEVVASRARCATLALSTVQAAVRRIVMDRKLKAAGHSDEDIARMRALLEQRGAPPGVVLGQAARDQAGSTEGEPHVGG